MKKEFYRRSLPHLQPLGGTFFVTFNLYGSIPKEVLKKWEEEFILEKERILQFSDNIAAELERLGKLDFAKRDKFYDTYQGGNHYLKSPTLAKIVADSIHFWDDRRFELYAYCIMSNHVHIVFRLFDESEIEKPYYLEQVMHSIKRYSSFECNKLLGLNGEFWQSESYDRLVRDTEELKRIIRYVLNNPVAAGLCSQMKDWQWFYVKEIYNEYM
ncbi:MAG: transposase [Spirosomataceae bacterium]